MRGAYTRDTFSDQGAFSPSQGRVRPGFAWDGKSAQRLRLRACGVASKAFVRLMYLFTCLKQVAFLLLMSYIPVYLYTYTPIYHLLIFSLSLQKVNPKLLVTRLD